jgi:hypothetical protein
VSSKIVGVLDGELPRMRAGVRRVDAIHGEPASGAPCSGMDVERS